MIFVSNKFSVFFIIHNNLVDWSSEMLGHIPIVDGSVGITRAKNWGITVSISDINLAIVNLVLVKGVFWLHHSVRVQMCTIEENSSTSKSVCVDLSCLLTTKSGIKRTFERPWAVSLFLENELHVVKTFFAEWGFCALGLLKLFSQINLYTKLNSNLILS